MVRAAALITACLLGGCSPSNNDNSNVASYLDKNITVHVLSARLDAVYLPTAKVEVTNNGGVFLRSVFVKCLFYKKDGSFIGDGLDDASNLSPGASDIVSVSTSDQYQKPAKATCRVVSAR